MAPFRASRSTRSDRRTGGHTEADVFDGLPVRQWRLHESIVAPSPSLDSLDPSFGANHPPGHMPGMQQRNMRQLNKWTAELPMPKGSELYAPWCQQLLRAARAGRVRKRMDDDCLQQARDDDKESGEDNDTTQQTELKGFMARRWTQLPRQMERPESEYLAKRRKGLASVVPLPGMPGMVGSDGQGAAAEGALNQPVVEERKRNMPPRRKPKKGPKKKKMSDGAGLGVSASAEALAASHATGTATGSTGENGAVSKPEGEDVAMQDAEEDGEEGESGEDEEDDEADGEESETAPNTSESTPPKLETTADVTMDANVATKRPQHPLANEISATEAMAEPTADDPQAPPPVPVADEAIPAPESIAKLEHDLVPELTDEPAKEDVLSATHVDSETQDQEMVDADTKPAALDSAEVAEAKHPISAAEVRARVVPEGPSTTAITQTVEDVPLAEAAEAAPRSILEAEAMEQDAIAGRDDTAQEVPVLKDASPTFAEPAPAVQAAQIPTTDEVPLDEPSENIPQAVDEAASAAPTPVAFTAAPASGPDMISIPSEQALEQAREEAPVPSPIPAPEPDITAPAPLAPPAPIEPRLNIAAIDPTVAPVPVEPEPTVPPVPAAVATPEQPLPLAADPGPALEAPQVPAEAAPVDSAPVEEPQPPQSPISPPPAPLAQDVAAAPAPVPSESVDEAAVAEAPAHVPEGEEVAEAAAAQPPPAPAAPTPPTTTTATEEAQAEEQGGAPPEGDS